MCCDKFSNNQCAIFSEEKILVVQENRCEYRVHNLNKKQLCKVTIDGCYITEGIKCDYLVINCNDNNAYFVELKGSDIFHGIEQLEATISRMRANIANCQIYSRIVLTKVSVPNIENNPKILRHKKMIKKLGGNFMKCTIQFNEHV